MSLLKSHLGRQMAFFISYHETDYGHKNVDLSVRTFIFSELFA